MSNKPKDIIQEIIDSSGNNFHSEVIEFLREKKGRKMAGSGL
jgi:hypothetical protein